MCGLISLDHPTEWKPRGRSKTHQLPTGLHIRTNRPRKPSRLWWRNSGQFSPRPGQIPPSQLRTGTQPPVIAVELTKEV